jgi:L-seryl-tRNA(Ser) seleniumtransferase
VDEFATQLRSAATPVIARVEDGRVLLDLRTVFPEQEEALAGALAGVGSARRGQA